MSMPIDPDDPQSAIRYDTTRYRCPHCRRSYAHQATATKHIARCFRNPAVQSCKTCRFYGLTEDGFECDQGVDLSGAFCTICGADMLPDGSGCTDHYEAKPVYNLRVRCDLWEAS